MSFWDRRLYIKWHIVNNWPSPDLSVQTDSGSCVAVGPSRIKQRGYLLRNHLLMQENVAFNGWTAISVDGELWSVNDEVTQCTLEGREIKGQGKFSCLNFPCLRLQTFISSIKIDEKIVHMVRWEKTHSTLPEIQMTLVVRLWPQR